MKTAVFLLGALAALFVSGARASNVAFYRYYNSGNTDHYYTTDYSTLGSGALGWVYEEVACYVDDSYDSGTEPLYEYNNSGKHFYTTNYSELGSGEYGYTFSGIACYVWSTEVDGTTPWYRFVNSTTGTHLYTTDYDEGIDAGYTYEHEEGYVISS